MSRIKVTPREPAHQPRVLEVREDDHVVDHDAPRLRTRRRKSTVNEDMFYVPVDEIPEGLSYEWKRWTVTGQHDPFYIASMREQGWEPVPPKRHPHWVPPGYNEPHIIKNGMILMDRPLELTEEARRELRQLSRRQIKEAEQRLGKTGDGEMTRDYDGVRPKVEKGYFRPMVVED
jgi:hypothetical protein